MSVGSKCHVYKEFGIAFMVFQVLGSIVIAVVVGKLVTHLAVLHFFFLIRHDN